MPDHTDEDDPGEHRWFKLEAGRLDVGITTHPGDDPIQVAADFIHALGEDPGEVHIEITATAPPPRTGWSQPGCASGTWLTDDLIGRLADGFGLPHTLFAFDGNHWAQPYGESLFEVSYVRRQLLDRAADDHVRRLDP